MAPKRKIFKNPYRYLPETAILPPFGRSRLKFSERCRLTCAMCNCLHVYQIWLLMFARFFGSTISAYNNVAGNCMEKL